MRGEALGVTGQRARQPEEADADDRHGEREDRGLLRRARDEVSGRRHEPDAAAGSWRAEQDRAGGPRPRHRGEGAERSELRDHAASRSGCGCRRACREPHDAIRALDQLGAMRDHQHRAPGAAGARPRRATSATLSASRSAVGSSRMTSGASRRKARASPIRRRCPGESARPPSPTHRVVAGRERRDERVGAGERRGAPHRGIRRAGLAEPDVVGDAGAQERGPLRQPGDLAPPRGRVAGREIDAAHGHPSGRRAPRARGSGRRPCSCPRRSGPASATSSPGSSVRSNRSRTSPGRAGYANDTRSSRTAATAGLGGTRRPPGRGRRRGVQQLEHPARHREPVGAGVVLGAEPAQRQVELRREHQDRQARLEPERAADEPHADGDRDERDAERGRQLQHGAGQEADAQRAHRRAPVAVADLGQPRRPRPPRG